MVIKLRDVSKNYFIGSNKVEALKNISLGIDQREFLAIMGPSGSGKSTLMHILGCLDKPTFGEYELQGKDVSQKSDYELAKTRGKKIGFVFQFFNLLPRYSALGNVEMPLIYLGFSAKKRKEKALQALADVGLSARAQHKPSELSGGEQQRVAIARALVVDPLIILADEPTGTLDSKTGKQIMEIFKRLNKEKGVIIVIVTHEKEIAQYADRIIYLKDGEITTSANG